MAPRILSTLIHDKADEILKPVYTVDKDESSDSVRIEETPGSNSFINDTIHAARTLNNDPNNYKKKALLGLVGAGIGTGITAASLSNPKFRKILQKKNLPDRVLGNVRGILNDKPSTPKRLLTALAMATTPAAAYYAWQNLDRPERAVPAGAYAMVSNTISAMNTPSTHIPANLLPNAVGYVAGPMTTISGVNYAASNFQKIDEYEKRKEIKADPKLSDNQRQSALKALNNKEDMYSRYPTLRYAPYGEKLREYYNSEHGYTTPSHDYIRTKIRE